MKFSCDQCHAQYMIADEKLGERGVKVKCKKCQHIIIVRPQAAEEPVPEPEPEPEPPQPDPAAATEAGFPAFGGSQADPGQPFGGGDNAFDNQDTVVGMSPAAMGFPAAGDPAAASGDTAGLGDAFGQEAGAAGSFGSDPAAGGFEAGDTVVGMSPNLGAAAGAGAGAGWNDDELDQTQVGVNIAAMQAAVAAEAADQQPATGGWDSQQPAYDNQSYEQPVAQAQQPAAEDGQMGGAFDSLFGGEAASAPAHETTSEPSYGAESTPAGEKEWYVAIDDSQVGPIDVAEIEQRWDGRELDEDSLAWKAGMDDWLPVAEVPELAYLATDRPHQPAASFGQEAVGFGSGMAAAAGGGEVASAAPASSAALGPMSFGGGASQPAADVGWKPSAASALSSLVQEELVSEPEPAADSPAPAPVPEGMPSFGPPSDLFDPGGGAGNGGATPSFAAPAADGFASGGAGFAMPVAAPSPGGGGFRPIYAFFILVTILLLAGLGLIIWKVVLVPPRQPATTQPVAMAPQPRSNAGSAPAPGAARAAPNPTPPRAAPPSRAPRPAAKPPKAKNPPRRGGSKPRGQKSPKPSRDSMDDVFKKPVKESRDVTDIHGGVKKNATKVMGCLKNARSKGEIVPGTYTLILSWDIKPNGTVSNPRMTGPSKVMGTSLPACFARSMRKWKFSEAQKSTPVKNYPFGPFKVK